MPSRALSGSLAAGGVGPLLRCLPPLALAMARAAHRAARRSLLCLSPKRWCSPRGGRARCWPRPSGPGATSAASMTGTNGARRLSGATRLGARLRATLLVGGGGRCVPLSGSPSTAATAGVGFAASPRGGDSGPLMVGSGRFWLPAVTSPRRPTSPGFSAAASAARLLPGGLPSGRRALVSVASAVASTLPPASSP
eukprot:3464418-Alexandrium_andersonii.AAC.1